MDPWQVDISWTDSPVEAERSSEDNTALLRQAALQLQTAAVASSQEVPIQVVSDRAQLPGPDCSIRTPFTPAGVEGDSVRVTWSPHGASRWRPTEGTLVESYPSWTEGLELFTVGARTSSPIPPGSDLLPESGRETESEEASGMSAAPMDLRVEGTPPVGPPAAQGFPQVAPRVEPEFTWRDSAGRPRMSRARAEEVLQQIAEDWPDLLPAGVPVPGPGLLPPIQRPPVTVTPVVPPTWPSPPAAARPTLWGQPQVIPSPWHTLLPRLAPRPPVPTPVTPPFVRYYVAPGQQPQLPPTPKSTLGPMSCRRCGKEYTRRAYLVQHVERVHWGRQFRCATCGLKFTQRASIMRHLEKSGHEQFRLIFTEPVRKEDLEDQSSD